MTKIVNSDEIKIRRIKRNEFDEVFELILNSFYRENEITGLDVRRLRRNARFYSLVSGSMPILDRLHIELETLLVAVCGEKVVGQIHLVPLGKHFWSIDSTAVNVDYRGRGIFKNLMRESLKYIAERCGRRVFTSLWISNVAPVKVTKQLEFEVYETETRLLLETGSVVLPASLSSDISIRETSPADAGQILELCKTVCPRRTEVFRIEPSDFTPSLFSRLRSRIAGIHSANWVLEDEGKILGYSSITFTSPKEAANIDFLYMPPSKNRSERACTFLSHMINDVEKKGITKVIINLNIEWNDLLEVAQNLGFKPFATVYNMKKEMV